MSSLATRRGKNLRRHGLSGTPVQHPLFVSARGLKMALSFRPLAIDLFTGLHGWSEGLVAAGWRVIGFDIEDMCAQLGEQRHQHIELVLQDVRTLHGAQFRNADLIVASPPCQEFSYMAMPWTRGRQIARALRGEDEFPAGYRGSRTTAELTELFDACFRIQREAIAASGRHIPLVVENVRGAEPWVGRAAWSFGSYYLWGDVPALMPAPARIIRDVKPQLSGDGRKNPGFRFDGSGRSFQTESVNRHAVDTRKAAAARIAKIPFALSHWIGRVYNPQLEVAA